MRTDALKFAAGGAMLAVWVYLVAIGKADAPSLVEFLKFAMAGLIGHAANQGGKKP